MVSHLAAVDVDDGAQELALVHDVPEPHPGKQQPPRRARNPRNSLITWVLSGDTGSPSIILSHFMQ